MVDSSARPALFTRAFPLLILLFCLLLFFAPGLFFGQVYFFRDLGMEIVPKRQFFSDHHGFVLWNPYVFAGEPFAANPQSSAFYPLSLLWLLGPAEVVLGPYLALHFLLAGIFSYFLFLELGLARTSALAGASAFILGGGFASLSLQVVNLNSAAWIPGIFWLGLRMQKTGSLRSALALGLLIGLQILGGEPEICYLTLLCFAAYLLFRSWPAPATASARSRWLKPWLFFGLAVFIGLGLSAVQWLLTLEMTPLSNRASGFNLASASAYSLEPRDLISILVPHVFLDPASPQWGFGFWSQRLPYFLSIYPGIIVILLAGFALRSERPGEALFWTAIGLLSVWLALGPAGGLYSLAHQWLPGFDRFRYPERSLIFFGLALAALAGLGLEALPEQLRYSGTARSLLRVLPIVVILALVLGMSLSGALLPFPQVMPQLFLHSGIRSLLLALAAFVLIGLFARAPERLRFLLAILTFLLAFDLFLAHRRLNPAIERSLYTFDPPWVSELKDNRGPVPPRVFIAAPPQRQDQFLGRNENPRDFYRTRREWLQPFFALPFSIPDLHAQSSFRLALADELKALLHQADPAGFERLLAFCGVQKLAVPGQGVRPIFSPLPRAYLVFSERRVKSHDQALQTLLDPGFDPRREVVIECADEAPVISSPGSSSLPFQPAEISHYENEEVQVVAKNGRTAWLVLMDTYYPGWVALDDSSVLSICRANGFFRAVVLEPGNHWVSFHYRPTHLSLALGLSGGTALIAGLLFLVSWFKSKGTSQ